MYEVDYVNAALPVILAAAEEAEPAAASGGFGIGAVVLVLVVVLVVPVFLDGPPSEEEIVSTSVPLPGQSEQKTQTVVLDRDIPTLVISQGEIEGCDANAVEGAVERAARRQARHGDRRIISGRSHDDDATVLLEDDGTSR